MRFFKQKLKGFGLTELVLAIGIFAMISSSLLLLVVDSTRTLENSRRRTDATVLTKEVHSILSLLKSQAWFDIVRHTGLGESSFLYENNAYKIVDGVGEKNGLTYSFLVNPVNRDSSGNIVQEGGTSDFHTRLISIDISWKDMLGKSHTTQSELYINDWQTDTILKTTVQDFSAGVHSDTLVVDNEGGEIRLRSVLYPDWCNPSLSLYEYDIPGSAHARTVFAGEGHAYLGTAGSTTGEPFTKLNVQGVDPPILTVEGTYLGHTVNDIFVLGDYAFLATATDNREVLILDISSVPYVEIGYYDAPGSTDGQSVFVNGNTGYLAQGRVIRTFDLTSYSGSRSGIGSITIGWFIATVSKIHVHENYLYAVLDWDWYELAIIDVTNPSNMSITSQTSVNNQQVYDMFVSEDATRVYFGTNNSNSEDEFFILDTTQKTGARPKIASLDMGGTTIRGISVVENGNVVILVGTGGVEYKVYVITDERNPEYCGGMEINSGIYDVDSTLDTQGNAFSYIITGDTNNEFKIIRGGPGGGGEQGYGYVSSGTYTSPVIDSESATSRYYAVSHITDIPNNTSMKLQFRVGGNPSMSGSNWFGIDGTVNTFFEGSDFYEFQESTTGQYIQYRVIFESDTLSTPLFKEIVIYYDK